MRTGLALQTSHSTAEYLANTLEGMFLLMSQLIRLGPSLPFLNNSNSYLCWKLSDSLRRFNIAL